MYNITDLPSTEIQYITIIFMENAFIPDFTLTQIFVKKKINDDLEF